MPAQRQQLTIPGAGDGWPDEYPVLAEYALGAACQTVLHAVAEEKLPDCWVGAGFVRNAVWDRLHGHARSVPPGDIDVVYFEPTESDRSADRAVESELRKRYPGQPWSVTNQARMAARHGDRPYRSTGYAMTHWLETATAVALRVDTRGRVQVLAPFGLGDLFGLVVRATPHAARHRPDVYLERVAGKGWTELWPRLTVLPPSADDPERECHG